MPVKAQGKAKETRISAVVIRADGTREDKGLLVYWHRNPIRRLAWRVRNIPLIGRLFAPLYA